MIVTVTKTTLKDILYLRNLFLQETNFQIRYNACYERGWTDSFLLIYNDKKIGYGSIKGKEDHVKRDTIFEFYIVPSFRNLAPVAFFELLKISKAGFIECQSNDVFLTALLYQFAQKITSNVILFEDGFTSHFKTENVKFRKRNKNDVAFKHTSEPVGDYVLELNKQIIATGGFLLHYNAPFADLYMEVEEAHRRKGLGSFLIQELKRECYLAGRVPAARCNIDNIPSKATLLKAGLKVAGFMLIGEVKALK